MGVETFLDPRTARGNGVTVPMESAGVVKGRVQPLDRLRASSKRAIRPPEVRLHFRPADRNGLRFF